MNEDLEEAADAMILMTDLMMNRIFQLIEVSRQARPLVVMPLHPKKIQT
jgi:hypothetical protein